MPSVPKPSRQEVVEGLKALLPPGFAITNQDAFGVFGTYLELAAQGVADTRAVIADLVPQLFVTTASRAWLDAHAADHRLTRIAAR